MGDLKRMGLTRRVEALLAPWRGAASPGVTIGVVREGRLAVQAHAGMADIELGVPVDAGTAFRIASVSKQFTTAAVLMLEAEGRLRAEDSARMYLPELPDFGAEITLAHLMHNSSGIRDMLEIMRMGGIDLSFPIAPEDLMEGICRQRTLNFAPGSRYLYSNTNFLLLGRVVERVSGEALRDFLARRIFAPLGMSMTRMVESARELVPGLATGYLPGKDGAWMVAAHGFPLHGEGALVSSVVDLALWERSYSGGIAGRLGLDRQQSFTGGGLNHYARGLAVSAARGLRTVGHGGLWPGYRTEFLRIPERDEAVIVIANSGLANPHEIGARVLDILAEDAPQAHPVRALPGRDALADYAGRWVDAATPATVEFAATASGGLTGTAYGQAFTLAATADGRLAADRSAPDWTMHLAGDGSLIVQHDAGVTATYHRAPDSPALPAGLAGVYESGEMDAVWTIAAEGASEEDGLAVRARGPVGRGGPWQVEAVAGDLFRIWTPSSLFRGWMDVRATRDAAGAISGLFVNGGRVKNLVFTRRGA